MSDQPIQERAMIALPILPLLSGLTKIAYFALATGSELVLAQPEFFPKWLRTLATLYRLGQQIQQTPDDSVTTPQGA